MGLFDSILGKKQKSIDELEEETENLEAENRKTDQEVGLAEKKVMLARLKERGLSPKHFQFSWTAIRDWLKTH